MSKEFKRADYWRHSKIGKNRKKLQKWRRPTGRDNKLREKRGGHPKSVRVGFKSPRKESGKIEGKTLKVIYTLKELGKASADNVIIIGKVGAKKKFELIKRAKEMNLRMLNVRGGENAAR